MMHVAQQEEVMCVGKSDAECESTEDGDCFNCGFALSNGGGVAGIPLLHNQSIVPSRTLKFQFSTKNHLGQDVFHSVFEGYGPLQSCVAEGDNVTVRFCDLRHAMAACEVKDVEGHVTKAEFGSDSGARDFDEEGRVVVRVDEHLGGNELSHIFSTYGDVRNVQDVPNVNIHKVVEFFDVRAAEKAIEALNAVDSDAMHAASVAYLERTRCKLFLIPPRRTEAAKFVTEGGPYVAPRTFPLGGASKPTMPGLKLDADGSPMAMKNIDHSPTAQRDPAMSRFFDSSSSLISTAEQFTLGSVPQPTAFNSFSGIPDSRATVYGDQSSNDGSAGLSLKEVLPSGLGLYEDEDEAENSFCQTQHSDSAAYDILSANRDPGWGPMLSNGFGCLKDSSFEGFSPLPSSFMEQISGTPTISSHAQDPFFAADRQQEDAVILSQYLKRLEEAAAFQQAVRVEVMRRLSALKCFHPSGEDSNESAMQKLRSSGEWKTTPSSKPHHRKKGGRFPRRGSALDLEQDAERRAQQEKMFAMDLERVRSGKDKRTTLMIKNIPNKYTQRMLLARIEQEFKGTFDFFYLPIDFKNKCNVGYGFINMTSTDHIVSFVEHVHEQKWDKFNSDKVCCVTYARIQGRHALINHFQNSSLMLEDSKHQPLLFKPNGEPEHLPMKAVNL